MISTLEAQSPEATKRLARLAGAVYVSLGIASALGFYHAPVIQSDPGAIARSLVESGHRFRIGVVLDILSIALAVPLALLLYQLFETVHKAQARLMAVLLLVAVPVSFVVALNYVAAHWLLSGAPFVSALGGAERQALGMLFVQLHVHGVLAVEVFWGLWLLPFGLLVRRSRFFPPVLGALLIIAGVAYVAHSLTTLLVGGQRFLLFERLTLLARAAGELPIMLWLLVKGADARDATQKAP
jgi:hypothetical protein